MLVVFITIVGILLTPQQFLTASTPIAVSKRNLTREQRRLLRATIAGDVTVLNDLHAQYPNILQTRFSGTFNNLYQRLSGSSILHIATQCKKTAVVSWLVDHHHLAIDVQDARGDTVLLLTATNPNRIDMFRLLIAKGANVNAKNNHGTTPLHATLVNNNVEAARLLIAHGADINAKNKNGLSALHSTVVDADADCKIARLLIEEGANVNIQDNRLQTPLHHAIADDLPSIKTIQLLVGHGADSNIRDAAGKTPDDYAHAEVTDENEVFQIVATLLLSGSKDLHTHKNYRAVFLSIFSGFIKRLFQDIFAPSNVLNSQPQTALHEFSKNPTACVQLHLNDAFDDIDILHQNYSNNDLCSGICCGALYAIFDADTFYQGTAEAIMREYPDFAYNFFLENWQFPACNMGLLRLARYSDKRDGFEDNGPREQFLHRMTQPGRQRMRTLLPPRFNKPAARRTRTGPSPDNEA